MREEALQEGGKDQAATMGRKDAAGLIAGEVRFSTEISDHEWWLWISFEKGIEDTDDVSNCGCIVR